MFRRNVKKRWNLTYGAMVCECYESIHKTLWTLGEEIRVNKKNRRGTE